MALSDNMTCPFCDESNFDAPGLVGHLERGYCDVYESIHRYKTPLEKLADGLAREGREEPDGR